MKSKENSQDLLEENVKTSRKVIVDENIVSRPRNTSPTIQRSKWRSIVSGFTVRIQTGLLIISESFGAHGRFFSEKT